MAKASLVLAFGIAASLAAVAPAHANEARASGDPVVRSGAGNGYSVIGRLWDGEYYEVEECTRQSRWCLVSDRGEVIGWVRGSALVGSPAKVNVSPSEPLVTLRDLDWAFGNR
jgi:uncharacterized protein YraI